MSHMMHMASAVLYAPESDALERHKYGINKNRKLASTGGGRAWSDDEEVYLLQTRMQKMPYKHIAAHLKKTELACRLHYHQLSHGSNRRKRTTSVSSGSSSVGGHSPLLMASVPSPIREHEHVRSDSHARTPSPPGSSGSYESMASVPSGIQLPSILATPGSSHTSPRLPSILPKPMAMTPATVPARASFDASAHSTPLLPAATFTPSHVQSAPSLRLDCSALPPPPPASFVDMARLHAIYQSHRHGFWEAIAAEYGPGANPFALEQAWRSTGFLSGCRSAGPSPPPPQHQSYHQQMATPLTPGTSVDERDVFYNIKGSQDKTRISSILGIDANPRGPKERELVRRMEQERVVVSAAA